MYTEGEVLCIVSISTSTELGSFTMYTSNLDLWSFSIYSQHSSRLERRGREEITNEIQMSLGELKAHTMDRG